MALTANNNTMEGLGADTIDSGMIIKNLVKVFVPALLDLLGPGAASANGQVTNHSNTINQIPIGHFKGTQTQILPSDGGLIGDGSTIIAPTAAAAGIRRAPVVGVAAVTDVGKDVYATDENTYTLTVPDNVSVGKRVGVVWRYVGGSDATLCFVLFFGAPLQLNQYGPETAPLHLGFFNWATITVATIRTSIPLMFHGLIEMFWAIWDDAAVGAGGTATLKLQITPKGGAATDVGAPTTLVLATGGAVAGAVQKSAAITTANRFHRGDTLNVVGTANGGTQTSGHFDLYAAIRLQPGA